MSPAMKVIASLAALTAMSACAASEQAAQSEVRT